jgi:integrase
MKLTEQVIKGLAAAPGERLSVAVDGCEGLDLRVTSSGVKSWSFRYRPPNAPMRRLTVGRWPNVSLSAAKAAANRHKGNLGDGRDPKTIERAEKLRAGGGKTFREIYDAFLKSPKRGGKPRAAGTTDQYKMAMEREDGPLSKWGGWPAGTISRSAVMDYLDEVDERGLVARNRTQTMIKAIFAFAANRGDLEKDPLDGVRKVHSEGVRDRVLSDAELGKVWRELHNPKSANGVLVRLALRLIALTACRVSEVSSFERGELSAAGTIWTVPAARAKNGKPHRVPMVPQMSAVIDQATAHVTLAHGKPIEWVFPASGLFDRAVTRFALRDACWAIANRLKIERFSPHDLRRTWTQIALRLKIAPHVIDAQLAHTSGSVSALMGRPELSEAFKHYGLAFDYLDERREALAKVAAFFDDISLHA